MELITNVVRKNRLRWFGHVERKQEDDRVKGCVSMEIEGARPRGRPHITWKEVIPKDLKRCGLKRENAQDRSLWRRLLSGKVC